MASSASPRAKRADARRNEQALLDAAAAAFVDGGVEVPIRDIANRAGVGTATIYRHFPTRADLVIAVYRHQVEELAKAGPALLASESTAVGALDRWIDSFIDFLVTKHGLASVLRSNDPCFDPLHAFFLDTLVPVCTSLLDAARAAGEVESDIEPIQLMRGVGNLCIGAEHDTGYDPRPLARAMIAGLGRG